MQIQLDTPRPVINPIQFPEHVVIMAHRREGVSRGNVQVAVVTSFERGDVEQVAVNPTRQFWLSDDGRASGAPADILEYVIPFFEIQDSLGRTGSTFGFRIVAFSAYRSPGNVTSYQERSIDFWVTTPLNGGGILRLSGPMGMGEIDISNPTFNPSAPPPPIGPQGEAFLDGLRLHDDVLLTAYRRVHGPSNTSAADAAERRRQQRLASIARGENPIEFITHQGTSQVTPTEQSEPSPAPARRTRHERIDEVPSGTGTNSEGNT